MKLESEMTAAVAETVGTKGEGKFKRYKVTLDPRTNSLLEKKPFDESHVAFLVSISNMMNMGKKYLEAVFNLLESSNVSQLTVLLGGFLRRHNFWQSKHYSPSSTELPTKEQMEKEAADIEEEWIKEHSPLYAPLQKKLGSKFKLIRWRDFIDDKTNSEYKKIYDEQVAHYNNNSDYQEEFEITINKYIKSAKINPLHRNKAKDAIRDFIFEETPMLSSKILPCDYLIYADKMNNAIQAAYNVLNPNEDPSQCRWSTIKGQDEIIEKKKSIPIGYSSMTTVEPKPTDNKSKEKEEDDNRQSKSLVSSRKMEKEKLSKVDITDRKILTEKNKTKEKYQSPPLKAIHNKKQISPIRVGKSDISAHNSQDTKTLIEKNQKLRAALGMQPRKSECQRVLRFSNPVTQPATTYVTSINPNHKNEAENFHLPRVENNHTAAATPTPSLGRSKSAGDLDLESPTSQSTNNNNTEETVLFLTKKIAIMEKQLREIAQRIDLPRIETMEKNLAEWRKLKEKELKLIEGMNNITPPLSHHEESLNIDSDYEEEGNEQHSTRITSRQSTPYLPYSTIKAATTSAAAAAISSNHTATTVKIQG